MLMRLSFLLREVSINNLCTKYQLEYYLLKKRYLFKIPILKNGSYKINISLEQALTF
jgi:hypothetical protein